VIPGNVWHGTQEPWQNWDFLAGRFVSEFGMYIPHPNSWPLDFDSRRRQGYPNIRTVDHWLGGDKSERFPQSR
jgi:beta-mannosidase